MLIDNVTPSLHGNDVNYTGLSYDKTTTVSSLITNSRLRACLWRQTVIALIMNGHDMAMY